MPRVKYILAGLICTILAATPAWADGGDFNYYNGPLGVLDGENASVAMEAETVTAALGLERVEVRASFTFANRGEAAVVTMFFPLGHGNSILAALDGLETRAEIDGYLLKEYGITVDEPLKETAYALPLKEDPSLLGQPNSELAISRYAGFRVAGDGGEIPVELVHRVAFKPEAFTYSDVFARWKVAFAAGETQTITCTYSAFYDIPKHGMGAKSFIYPLYTGKTWAGPIGRGTVTVTYKDGATGAPVSFRSPGMPPAEVSADKNETSIVWRFTAFEPGEDTSIYIEIAECLSENFRAIAFERLGLNADKAGEPGRVLVDNLSFRTAPSADAARVKDRPKLAQGAPLAVLESRGEWWRVRVPGGAGDRGDGKDDLEGWIRWR